MVEGLTRKLVDENSSSALDQDEYHSRYDGMVNRHDQLRTKILALEKKRTERMAKADAISGFMFRLRELDLPLEHFDERLWLEVIDHVTVHRDGGLTFRFWDGSEHRV